MGHGCGPEVGDEGSGDEAGKEEGTEFDVDPTTEGVGPVEVGIGFPEEFWVSVVAEHLFKLNI